MVLSLVYASEDESFAYTCLRRGLLLIATWLLAHIDNMLSLIAAAIDATLGKDGEGGENGNGARAGENNSAARPSNGAQPTDGSGGASARRQRAERPTLKAGFSCPQVGRGSEATHAWSALPADNFRVRTGPNYAKNGLKAPSAGALGEVVAVDVLRSESKISDFLSLNHIELPPPSPEWKEVYPELLVINQQMPVHFHNSLFTSESTDGETLHLIVYVRLKPGLARGYATDQEPVGAEQLLKRFLLRADQDPDVAHCFKEIGLLRNLDELAGHMPSSLTGARKAQKP